MRKNTGIFNLTIKILSYPFIYPYLKHKRKHAIKELQIYQKFITEHQKQLSEQIVDNCVEMFTTNCGDIIVSRIFRNPDLTAEIIIMDKYGNTSKPYNRKIYKKGIGYYFKLDGINWYFNKYHEEFYTELMEFEKELDANLKEE